MKHDMSGALIVTYMDGYEETYDFTTIKGWHINIPDQSIIVQGNGERFVIPLHSVRHYFLRYNKREEEVKPGEGPMPVGDDFVSQYQQAEDLCLNMHKVTDAQYMTYTWCERSKDHVGPHYNTKGPKVIEWPNADDPEPPEMPTGDAFMEAFYVPDLISSETPKRPCKKKVTARRLSTVNNEVFHVTKIQCRLSKHDADLFHQYELPNLPGGMVYTYPDQVDNIDYY